METCEKYWRDQHYQLLLIDHPFLEVTLDWRINNVNYLSYNDIFEGLYFDLLKS